MLYNAPPSHWPPALPTSPAYFSIAGQKYEEDVGVAVDNFFEVGKCDSNPGANYWSPTISQLGTLEKRGCHRGLLVKKA